RPRPRPAGDPEVPHGDGQSRRRGHAAVDHRDRLGIGAPRPLRDQQGPHRPRADAEARLQADPSTSPPPEPPTRLAAPMAAPAALADGAHGFSVKAIDPPGNESAVITRSFTVDTTP